ncbi:MAG: hypothetical protein HY666_04195 [Chloroflexi bacterium]|nr:hypothetical protein [Chloroflexota bacterium]
MSVGHTARVIEGAGISTVCIYIRAFRHQAQALKPPRTLITPHLLGRTVGSPDDIMRQRGVTRAALRLLETASKPGTIAEFAPALR